MGPSGGDIPVVNSWTEFGDLEYICIGSCLNAAYPEPDPIYTYNLIVDETLSNYVGTPCGPRPKTRIARAEAELENLCSILEGESISIGSIRQVDEDIKLELARKRSWILDHPNTLTEDKRIAKKGVEVVRPPPAHFDVDIVTPWFRNKYQFSYACPRDSLITMGNTILEAPTGSRVRYFESNYFRPLISKLWDADKRVHWKTGPQPTCGDHMYHPFDPNNNYGHKTQKSPAESGYETALNEIEMAFDAADMMRVGLDVFYKRSATANIKGLEWLRREFPQLRFHMTHYPTDTGPHIDVNLVPLRPPTPGSQGILLINQNFPPLASEMTLWKENEWRPLWCPLPVTNALSPVAVCSPNLNMNLLSLSSKCVLIEEAELPLYHFLDDLGWDVVTVPLRALNEFGGGLHCVTWDIRRRDGPVDYFPIQDYEFETHLDLQNFHDGKIYEG